MEKCDPAAVALRVTGEPACQWPAALGRRNLRCASRSPVGHAFPRGRQRPGQTRLRRGRLPASSRPRALAPVSPRKSRSRGESRPPSFHLLAITQTSAGKPSWISAAPGVPNPVPPPVCPPQGPPPEAGSSQVLAGSLVHPLLPLPSRSPGVLCSHFHILSCFSAPRELLAI